MNSRLDHLVGFYAALDRLAARCNGARRLATCTGRMAWPQRGVYFFMEGGEARSDSGQGPRVVRVGTHALTTASRTTLWTRLAQHRGQRATGGGNHRGSIFRLLVGSTLVTAETCATWGIGASASADVRHAEEPVERQVSEIIGAMSVLWLAVADGPGPQSLRGYIERNSIALLSNYGRPALDSPSSQWRGRACDRGRARVRESGLWNQNHVDGIYDPAFIGALDDLIGEMEYAR